MSPLRKKLRSAIQLNRVADAKAWIIPVRDPLRFELHPLQIRDLLVEQAEWPLAVPAVITGADGTSSVGGIELRADLSALRPRMVSADDRVIDL